MVSIILWTLLILGCFVPNGAIDKNINTIQQLKEFDSFDEFNPFIRRHTHRKLSSLSARSVDAHDRKLQGISGFLSQIFQTISSFFRNLLNLEDENPTNGSITPPENPTSESIIPSENPTSYPSIIQSNSPSSQFSSTPTLSPSNHPTNVPSNTPTTDRSWNWRKSFSEIGSTVKLSETGNTLLIFKEDGSTYIYERNVDSNDWSQTDVTNLLSNVWGDLSTLSDDLFFELSSSGDKFIAGNTASKEVVVFFFHTIASIWYQVGNAVHDASIIDFGKFVDITVDGSRILAGGTNGLIQYVLNFNSWETIGSLIYPIESLTFSSASMNDAGTNVIANIKDHEDSYYDSTPTVRRYVLPSFQEFPSYPIDPYLFVIGVSASSNGKMMAVTVFDHEDHYNFDDSYYPLNDVYIYEFDDDANECYLITVLEGFFALSNSMSGDGSSLMTIDSTRSINTGEYLYRSHAFFDEGLVETGFVAPDEGDSDSISISISNDGSKFATVFGDIINVWETSF